MDSEYGAARGFARPLSVATRLKGALSDYWQALDRNNHYNHRGVRVKVSRERKALNTDTIEGLPTGLVILASDNRDLSGGDVNLTLRYRFDKGGRARMGVYERGIKAHRVEDYNPQNVAPSWLKELMGFVVQVAEQKKRKPGRIAKKLAAVKKQYRSTFLRGKDS